MTASGSLVELVVYVVVVVVARLGVVAVVTVAARFGVLAVVEEEEPVQGIQTQTPLLLTHLVSFLPRRLFDHYSHTPPLPTPLLLPSFHSSRYPCSNNSMSSPSDDIFSRHGRPLHDAPHHTPDHLGG